MDENKVKDQVTEGQEGGENSNQPFKSFASEKELMEFIKPLQQSHASKKQKELLDRMGINKVDDFIKEKEEFEKFKSEKLTEEEKLKLSLEQKKQEHRELTQRVEKMNFENLALKNNVKPEVMDDIYLLANNYLSEDVTMEQALEKVIEKYPHFAKVEDTKGFKLGMEKEEPQQSKKSKNSKTNVKRWNKYKY